MTAVENGMALPINPIYRDLGTTIFEVMSRLARQHDAVNLGQGFPDEAGPDDVRQAAADALVDGWNQYPPMLGLPELRRAVADHDRRFYGFDLDPESEVLVTSGATEALAAACLALLEPDDEVVVFEPLYDAYLPMIRRAGAIPKPVRLNPPDWVLDPDALGAAVGPRCRMILLNDPMNPAAKVWPEAERAAIAALAQERNLTVVCDEVYEHLVFDAKRHRPLMAEPGMAERCLRIGSAGKTFSLTGWKVGYAVGPPELIAALAKAHQFLTFTTPPNLQAGVAFGLGKPDSYFVELAARMEKKRNRLAVGLDRLGFQVLPCQGTYFLNIDVSESGIGADALCRRLVAEAGLAAIPLSPFYDRQPDDRVVRFCFAKQDRVLDAAVDRLAGWLHRQGASAAQAAS